MEHRAELDALQAAALILTAAMAFGSLVLYVRGGEGCLIVLGLAVPPLAAGHHMSSPSGVQRKINLGKGQLTNFAGIYVFSFLSFWRGFQSSTVKHNFVMGI